MLRPVENDPNTTLDFHIVEETLHKFRYHMWFAPPGAAEWTSFGEGEGEGNHKTGPLPDGSQTLVWINVGGKANSNYRIRITISQDGTTVPGGDSTCSGQTSGDGGGVCTDHVLLV